MIIEDGTQARVLREWEIQEPSSLIHEELREVTLSRFGLVFALRWDDAAPQFVVDGIRLGLHVIALELNGVPEVVVDARVDHDSEDARSLMKVLEDVASSWDDSSECDVDQYSAPWHSEIGLGSWGRIYPDVTGTCAL